MNKVLQVHPEDNIAVALQDLASGARLSLGESQINPLELIPAKHKFNLTPLAKGDQIVMYGVVVGRATTDIPAFSRLTTRNIEHFVQSYQTGSCSYQWTPPDVSRFKNRHFMGYHRKNGKVGTMNYWLVIPLVFCENRNVEVIKSGLLDQLGYDIRSRNQIQTDRLIKKYLAGATVEDIMATEIIEDLHPGDENRLFKNVDGIKFLTHEGGCGGTKDDSEMLCRLLASYIVHPNVAGATVLSLGCQHVQINLIQEAIQVFDPHFDKPLFFLEQQQSLSEKEFISEAVKKTFVGLMEANASNREEAPISKLILGLECGGSDGFSGITANPVLGHTTDLLVALGGAAILSEFPELNGVEQELINRCTSLKSAEKFSRIMKAYGRKAESVGSGFFQNPSPGNIRDGLTTDGIKSAGAAKKGGTSPVTDVLDYSEINAKPGLNLLCTPGNDVESTTGLAGAGSNVIVFTTGLGTPTGNPISPVIKISSNTDLAVRMKDIIDMDAGTILSANHSIEYLGEELLNLIIDVSSGHIIPKSVQLGQDDFIPWKRGISL